MNFLKSIMIEIGSKMQEAAKKKKASFYETFPDRRTLKEKWNDAVKAATDKDWSTAREPNPNDPRSQDGLIEKLFKKFK